MFPQTRRRPGVRAHPASLLDQVTTAVGSMSAAAAASLGQFQAALELTDALSADNPYVATEFGNCAMHGTRYDS
jgi:hypothetical protein